VKFLVDHQLPPALARLFESLGHNAQHVRELGLMQALDPIIGQHATANQMVVVSKDEDFYNLATAPSSTIRLIWVRVGNCRTKALLEIFKAQLPRILAAFESGSRIVEIR
jgi:predicted nuclease of predicted toxin-antitoxin system